MYSEISEHHVEAVNNLLSQRGYGSEMEIWKIAFGRKYDDFDKYAQRYIADVCDAAGWVKIGPVFPKEISSQYRGRGKALYEKALGQDELVPPVSLSDENVLRSLYASLKKRHGEITAYGCFGATGTSPKNYPHDLRKPIRAIEKILKRMGWSHNGRFRKERDGIAYKVFVRVSLREKYERRNDPFADILG